MTQYTKALKAEYGFVANPNLPKERDASTCNFASQRVLLLTVPTGPIPNPAACILGLGLKFCICDRHRRIFLTSSLIDCTRSSAPVCLSQIGWERHPEPVGRQDLRMEPRLAPEAASQEIESALDRLEGTLLYLVCNRRQQFHAYPARHELNQIRALRNNPNITILHTDKNLGPAAMDMKCYVRKVLTEHLLKQQHQLLSAAET